VRFIVPSPAVADCAIFILCFKYEWPWITHATFAGMLAVDFRLEFQPLFALRVCDAIAYVRRHPVKRRNCRDLAYDIAGGAGANWMRLRIIRRGPLPCGCAYFTRVLCVSRRHAGDRIHFQ
jgi:hypothetical protein